MARKSATAKNIAAILLIVAGAGLAYWAYQQYGASGAHMEIGLF
jgi:hypothetical protein